MTRIALKRALRLGVGLGLLVALSGCAKEMAPINRVQANALDKSFFVGPNLADPSDDPEFYWRGYVTDASASQSLVGVGSWSGVDRIRWEITEDMLIARKSYPLVTQPDEPGSFSGPDSVGTVVAAYKILSHFDIRRAYNPQTGEEENIIEENSTDRPWYERQYMRVDWSTNQVNDPMWSDMFMGKVFGDISVTPMTYTVTDPNDPNAPHFEADDGYFDITNRFYIAPALTSIWGWQIQACLIEGWFTGTASYECDAQEATVRFSFKKVDPNDDFEPLENSRASLDVVGNPGGLGDSLSVGIVTAPRQGYDPAYGYVDKNFKRYANIHNIWQRSHQDVACSAHVDQDGNGTDDQCENATTGYAGSSGSQCDLWAKKCTIPYRDRVVKTNGYWVNTLMPAEFQDPLDESGNPTGHGASEDIIYTWNEFMKNAAGYAREVECRRTGDGDRDTCHAKFFAPDKQMVRLGGWLTDKSLDETPALTLCHNPVRSYDIHEVCGETGAIARTGDIRKNMMVYWPYDSRAPWGGIADWNGDPLSGQIIGGMAEAMGRSVTYAAAYERDFLQLAMGDITVDDVIAGVPQNEYFSQAVFNPSANSYALSKEEIARRISDVDAKNAAQALNLAPLDGDTMAKKMASFNALKATMIYDPASEAAAVTRFDALVSPFLGTQLENDIVGPTWLRSTMGLGPNATATSDIMDLASPLRGLDPAKQRILRDTIRGRLEAKGACFLDSDAPVYGSIAIQGLARYFKHKYADLSPHDRGVAIYNDLLVETYKGIELHEVGHSLGLLHQFASSWDSPNYEPQYWQLRTNEGQAAVSCNGAARTGDADSCMGPRYLDPETLDEQGLMGDENDYQDSHPDILYYGNTSTMEYQWDRFGESAGAGPYDEMAMQALYGRVLQTMDDRAVPVADQQKFGPRMVSQLNEQDLVMQTTKYGTFPQPVHYTELAREMKVFDPQRDCRPATDEEKNIAQWRIIHGQICAPAPRDHAAWQDFLGDLTNPADPNSAATAWHTPTDPKKGGGNVRWFYRWGSTDNAYIHTNPSDAGADPYEVSVDMQRKLVSGYPWQYFRNTRRDYAWWNLPERITYAYFEAQRTYHWNAAMHAAEFMRNFGPTTYAELAQSDDWLRPYLMASTESFKSLAGALLMPQPGDYYAAANRTVTGWQQKQATPYDVTSNPPSFGVPPFKVGLGDGRYIDDQFDSSPSAGGSWDYTNWMQRAGFQVEKAYAVALLADGRAPVYTPNRALFLDPRTQDINFYADMPNGMDRLLAGLLAEDWETIGQHYANGSLQWYDFTQPGDVPARPTGSYVLFPNVGYNQQSIAAILAAVYSRETGDMTMLNKMRIFIDGVDGPISGTGIPDAEQVRFFNPNSGMTYIARSFGRENINGKSVEKGVGARMLLYANIIMSNTYNVQREGGSLTGAPVLNQYGQVQLVTDANGQPVLKASDAANTELSRLINYVGMVDALRQIGLVLGGGPL